MFKNGDLQRVLNAGTYWRPYKSEVMVYKTTKPFVAPVEWAILEKNEALMSLLEVIDVADTELVIEYKDKRFSKVLTSGKYAYWKGVLNLRFERFNLDTLEIPKSINRKLLALTELRKYIRVFEVFPSEKGLALCG